MRYLLVFLAICVFFGGCIGSKEKIDVVDVAITRNGNHYTGKIVGANSGDATYKMCVAELRGGEKDSMVIGTVEKSLNAGPNADITINIDERYREGTVTAAAICCYKSEAYSGNPTCSDGYLIE
jgi:hypothetical protein